MPTYRRIDLLESFASCGPLCSRDDRGPWQRSASRQEGLSFSRQLLEDCFLLGREGDGRVQANSLWIEDSSTVVPDLDSCRGQLPAAEDKVRSDSDGLQGSNFSVIAYTVPQSHNLQNPFHLMSMVMSLCQQIVRYFPESVSTDLDLRPETLNAIFTFAESRHRDGDRTTEQSPARHTNHGDQSDTPPTKRPSCELKDSFRLAISLYQELVTLFFQQRSQGEDDSFHLSRSSSSPPSRSPSHFHPCFQPLQQGQSQQKRQRCQPHPSGERRDDSSLLSSPNRRSPTFSSEPPPPPCFPPPDTTNCAGADANTAVVAENPSTTDPGVDPTAATDIDAGTPTLHTSTTAHRQSASSFAARPPTLAILIFGLERLEHRELNAHHLHLKFIVQGICDSERYVREREREQATTDITTTTTLPPVTMDTTAAGLLVPEHDVNADVDADVDVDAEATTDTDADADAGRRSATDTIDNVGVRSPNTPAGPGTRKERTKVRFITDQWVDVLAEAVYFDVLTHVRPKPRSRSRSRT